MKDRVAIHFVLAVAFVAPALPAAAQEPTIRMRVPVEIVSELHHITDLVDALQRHLGDDVRHAARLSLGELRHLARAGSRDVVGSVGDLAFAFGNMQDRNFRVEQLARETRQFNLGASGILELRNLIGDVTVTAGTGSQATVDIVRRSRGRTAADAQRGLDEVTLDVSQESGRAAVATRYPQNQSRLPYSVTVSYTVRAPAGTRLTVGSVVGDINVTGITGDLSVDVVSGDVDIRNAARVVQLKTVSGDIRLTGAETTANMNISTLNGDITLRQVRAGQLTIQGVSGDVDVADATVGQAELKTISGEVRFAGGLQGNGRYEFQTHSGDVVLGLTNSNGFELEARTFNGDIRPDASFDIATLTAGRRSLQGRIGNGQAVVVATTFSGDIVIRRR